MHKIQPIIQQFKSKTQVISRLQLNLADNTLLTHLKIHRESLQKRGNSITATRTQLLALLLVCDIGKQTQLNTIQPEWVIGSTHDL
jgi:hypothetical protein